MSMSRSAARSSLRRRVMVIIAVLSGCALVYGMRSRRSASKSKAGSPVEGPARYSAPAPAPAPAPVDPPPVVPVTPAPVVPAPAAPPAASGDPDEVVMKPLRST